MKPLLFLLILIPFNLPAGPLEWADSGTLRVSNTEWQTLYMNPKWRAYTQSKDFAIQNHSQREC